MGHSRDGAVRLSLCGRVHWGSLLPTAYLALFKLLVSAGLPSVSSCSAVVTDTFAVLRGTHPCRASPPAMLAPAQLCLVPVWAPTCTHFPLQVLGLCLPTWLPTVLAGPGLPQGGASQGFLCASPSSQTPRAEDR